MGELSFQQATLNGKPITGIRTGSLRADTDASGRMDWKAVIRADPVPQLDEAGTFEAQIDDGRKVVGEVVRAVFDVYAGPGISYTDITLAGTGPLFAGAATRDRPQRAPRPPSVLELISPGYRVRPALPGL
jgi:hypothetical protein